MSADKGKRILLRLLCAAFVLLLAAALASCGKNSSGDDEEKIVLEPIPTAPSHSGKDIKGSPYVGNFTCSWSSVEHSPTDDPSWEGRTSTLTINEDGTFSLTFDSLIPGDSVTMATVTGTVKVSDDTAECTVEERNRENYLGSDVASFSLSLISSDELRYKGDQQGLVGNRDIFSRNP